VRAVLWVSPPPYKHLYEEFWILKIKIECPDGRVFYTKTDEIRLYSYESEYDPSAIYGVYTFVQIYCPDGCSSSDPYNTLSTQVPFSPTW
jgi:hypothetical protein